MSREAHPDYPEFRLIKRKDVTDHRRNNPDEDGKNSQRAVANNTTIL